MSLIHATSSFDAGDGGSRLFGEVRSKISAAVSRSQEILVEEAQAIVPVATGELRGSIHADPVVDDGQEVTGTVTAEAAHAACVEFGTGLRGIQSAGAGLVSYNLAWPGMPAQPYMRPAMDTTRGRILEEFSR